MKLEFPPLKKIGGGGNFFNGGIPALIFLGPWGGQGGTNFLNFFWGGTGIHGGDPPCRDNPDEHRETVPGMVHTATTNYAQYLLIRLVINK